MEYVDPMGRSRIPGGAHSQSSVNSAALDTAGRSSRTKETGDTSKTDQSTGRRSHDLDEKSLTSTKSDSSVKSYLQASQVFVPVGASHRLEHHLPTQDVHALKSDHSVGGGGRDPAALVLGHEVIPDFRRLRIGQPPPSQPARPASRDNDRPLSPLSPTTAGTMRLGDSQAGSPTSRDIRAQLRAERARVHAERARHQAGSARHRPASGGGGGGGGSDPGRFRLDRPGGSRGAQTLHDSQAAGQQRARLTRAEKNRLHHARPPRKRATAGAR